MAVRIESQAEPLPGYRLIARLGGGGFGEVWKCEAPGGFHKAIKFVFGNLDLAGDGGQRAEQELKALKRVMTVRHPYILSLERFDILDGQLLIVLNHGRIPMMRPRVSYRCANLVEFRRQYLGRPPPGPLPSWQKVIPGSRSNHYRVSAAR